VRIVCGELAAPEHGALTLEKGDRLARFTCDVGFRLEGAAELRCLDDSTWDLAPPTCLRVTCQDLGQMPVEHGQVGDNQPFKMKKHKQVPLFFEKRNCTSASHD